MFIYFLRGSLPWQNIKAGGTPMDQLLYRRIAQCKLKVPIDRLCSGLPSQ